MPVHPPHGIKDDTSNSPQLHHDALKQAIQRAKASQLDDDAENMWAEHGATHARQDPKHHDDANQRGDSTPCPPWRRPVGSTAGEAQRDDLGDTEHAVLTVLPDGRIEKEINAKLTATQVDVNITEGDQVEKMLDDVTWNPIQDRLHNYLKSQRIKGALMVHPGTTFTSACRGTHPYGNKDLKHDVKHRTRTETCLAMRILTLAWYCIMYVIPFAVILPGYSNDPAASLHILREWDEIRSRTRQYTLKGYGAVITNMKQNHKSIKELIRAIEGDAELLSHGSR